MYDNKDISIIDSREDENINFGTNTIILTSTKKSNRFIHKLLISVMAITVGFAFLGLGIGAGYVVMQNIMGYTYEVDEVTDPPLFQSMSYEPIVVTIDPQTPDFTDVIARVKDSVVSINVTSQRNDRIQGEHVGAGSGFFFAQDDEYVFVATNYHVVENTTSITISIDDNEEVPAHMIGAEPDYDLAVLAVSLNDLHQKSVPFVIAELGCSDSMRMGDSVVAIGNAMGAGQSVTKGIISAVNLEISVHNQNTNSSLSLNVLQTDAAVNQGNSGGPLINHNGEVIGIVTAKLFGHGIEGMGYVLPTNDIRDMLLEIKILGSVRQAWMGIHSDEITEAIREMFNLPSTGMLIRAVVEDSPAYNAGIMEWDLLVSFSGQTLTNRLDLFYAMQEYEPGDEVVVGIYRNGVYLELVVVLGGMSIVR